MPFTERYCDPKRVWNSFAKRFDVQLKGCTNKDELHTILKRYVLFRWTKADEDERGARLGLPPTLPPKRRFMVQVPLPLTQETKCQEQIKEWESALEETKKNALLNAPKSGSTSGREHTNQADFRKNFRQDFDYLQQQQLGEKDNLANMKYTQMTTYLARVKRKLILARATHLLKTLDPTIRFILWVNSKTTRKKVAALLRTHGVSFIEISGQTSKSARKQMIDAYQQADSEYRVALLSIKACCDGITLTRASHAYFTVLKPVPSIMAQAEDRIHRLCQRAAEVHIEYWIVPRTVDELE